MNFFSRHRRVLLIILFIVFILVAGYLLYYLFFKSQKLGLPSKDDPSSEIVGRLPESATGTPSGVDQFDDYDLPDSSDLPTDLNLGPVEKLESTADPVALGGVTAITDVVNQRTVSPTMNNTGNIQYYDPYDGHFYKIGSDGVITSMGDRVFHSVQNITWSKNGNQAVLEYPDDTKIVYDFTKNKQVTLPKHWSDFEFSTNSDRLVVKSLGMSVDDYYLAIANSDGSGGKIVEFIGQNHSKVYPSWSPNNQVIALQTEGLDYDRQTVYFLGQYGESFKSMTIPGRGFKHQWSPEGDRLLYSVYYSDNDMKPMLWITDASGSNIGNNRQMLNVQTWANKCTFANNNEVYCAVPTHLDYGAGYIPALSNNTPDQIYKINTKTGSKQLIAIPEKDITINNLMVSPDGSTLFFTNQKNNAVSKINLR